MAGAMTSSGVKGWAATPTIDPNADVMLAWIDACECCIKWLDAHQDIIPPVVIVFGYAVGKLPRVPLAQIETEVETAARLRRWAAETGEDE